MKKHILIFWILSSCIAYSSVAQVNYQWVKGIGGTGGDIGKDIAVDDSGYVYVTGWIGSGIIDFNPFGSNAVDINSNGSTCFFAKYDSVGNCKWAKNFQPASASTAFGVSIAVSGIGDIYVSGVFTGTVDFDASSSGSSNLTSIGGADVFLVKYNNGGVFQWVKQFGGNSAEALPSIAVNGTDTVYIAGYYESATAVFMNSSGSPEGSITNYGGKDGFLAGYSGSGTFLWAKSIGGMEDDVVNAVNANDSWVVVTGYFQDSLISGPDTIIAGGNQDAFFAKFTLDGYPAWAYSMRGQTGSIAAGTGVAIDAGTINITGAFKGAIDFPDPADLSQIAATASATGRQDVFFAKYQISHSFDFVKTIGGSDAIADSVISTDIALDPSGDIYLTGSFVGTIDFDPGVVTTTYSSIHPDSSDVFFAKYEPTGEYDWARPLGWVADDKGWSIAVDDSENVYITGTFQDTVDFDPGDFGQAKRESKGSNDIFIAKYSQGTSTISGTVYYGNNYVFMNPDSNYVRLYTQIPNDGNAAMHLVEQLNIDLNGMYSFNDVPNGDYIVLAVANGAGYAMAAPTYYGDTINWLAATHIIVQSNTNTADIHLDTTNFVFNGITTLSGTVKEGEGFDRSPGTPISSTSVGLDHEPEGIIAHTETNDQGYYHFDGVPAGNYTILVYIPGLDMNGSYDLSVDSTDILLDSLDFVADSSSIDTVSRIQTSVYSRIFQEIKIVAYPNPYKGTTTLEFTIKEKEKVKLEIYNVLGEKMAELMNEQKPSGTIKYQFNAIDKGLKAGIYILNLKVGNNLTTKRIIQIE